MARSPQFGSPVGLATKFLLESIDEGVGAAAHRALSFVRFHSGNSGIVAGVKLAARHPMLGNGCRSTREDAIHKVLQNRGGKLGKKARIAAVAGVSTLRKTHQKLSLVFLQNNGPRLFSLAGVAYLPVGAKVRRAHVTKPPLARVRPTDF